MPRPSLKQAALRRLNQRTHTLRTLPILILMPHRGCNARCLMCDIWRANKDRQQLTEADLRPHLRQLSRWSVERVVLSGGEALLHDNLWRLTELLTRELGAKITLLTTGFTLAQHAEAAARWLDEVIVSLDGDAELHDHIRRVPRAWQRLTEGVEALHRVDAELPIKARCVVQTANHRALVRTTAAALELGLSGISFLPVDTESDAFNRPGGPDAEQERDTGLGPGEIDDLEREIERLIAAFGPEIQSGYIAESAEKLRALPDYFRRLPRRVRCNAPWVSAVIEADGEVRPCFFLPPYGNWQGTTLDALLNGAAAVAQRSSLDVTAHPTCARCVCSLELGPRGRV